MEQLLDAVSFADIAPIILGVGAALMSLYVVIKAVKIAVGFVRGGYDGGSERTRSQDTPGNAERGEHDHAWVFEDDK